MWNSRVRQFSFVMTIVGIFGYFYAQDPSFQTAKIKTPGSVVTPAPQKSHRQPAAVATKMANVLASDKPTPFEGRGLSRLPKNYQVIPDETVDLGKNFSLSRGVAALPSHDWNPNRGELIHKDRFYTFFKPNADSPEGWPVAFDKVTQGFHPISHILHIKQATEEVRQELLGEGLKEYYFHPRLQYLALETSPTSVLSHYRDLKSRGFAVRIEVLKETVQAK